MNGHRDHEEGFDRIDGPGSYLDAVQWWYWSVYDDGFQFARGGNVRTARIARGELEHARRLEEAERVRFLRRPTHQLNTAGELVPL